jgi:hypothetical protein
MTGIQGVTVIKGITAEKKQDKTTVKAKTGVRLEKLAIGWMCRRT